MEASNSRGFALTAFKSFRLNNNLQLLKPQPE